MSAAATALKQTCQVPSGPETKAAVPADISISFSCDPSKAVSQVTTCNGGCVKPLRPSSGAGVLTIRIAAFTAFTRNFACLISSPLLQQSYHPVVHSEDGSKGVLAAIAKTPSRSSSAANPTCVGITEPT
ncbi:TPA: hypothetical protein ACH3X2_013397 [Trebouxia sp. C0005]